MQRITTTHLTKMKARGEKVVMVTAYDYPTACLVDEAGVDVVLVGDSLGMVVLGYETTLPVTIEEMLHHTKAVVRGVKRALVVTDLPFLTYQTGPEDAIRNAGRLLQEGGATAVKLEGGIEVCPQVRTLVSAGIPVVGHVGLTPQSIHVFGGYKLQGRGQQAAQKLLADARALEEAGIFCLVLECIPEDLAARITAALTIPTVGIGAGVRCDGQVLVLHDLLGITSQLKRPAGEPVHPPRFVKEYAQLGETIRHAVEQYSSEVRAGAFPAAEHSFHPAESTAPSTASPASNPARIPTGNPTGK
ncbi:MAG: 3-methyl-2-oxobutanoate hydroxymethyltransferase [Acidobacteria bacterium]|nr:3-methyl-2-oxobutanoate hydroxymethyltransferase [Acidobacteriota bacterium]